MRVIALERSKCLHSSDSDVMFCPRWLSPGNTTSFVFIPFLLWLTAVLLNTCFRLSYRHRVLLFKTFFTTFHVCPAAFRCAANKFVFARVPFRPSAMLDFLKNFVFRTSFYSIREMSLFVCEAYVIFLTAFLSGLHVAFGRHALHMFNTFSREAG